MKKTAFTITIAALFFSACEGGWTAEDKEQFMQVCREQHNGLSQDTAKVNGYCRCTLETTMNHYKTMEEVIVNKDSLAIRKELEDCNNKFANQ